jgi:hypothetical protein
MSDGFGLMGFGLGPFGLETPDEPPDPPTGTPGSRFLNPATGDYETDSVTNQLKQMPRNRQRVLLALMTLRRSASTAQGFGVRLPRKMGNSFEIETRQAVILALRHLTDGEAAIRLDSVIVERGRNGRAQVTVSYFDLEEQINDQVSL